MKRWWQVTLVLGALLIFIGLMASTGASNAFSHSREITTLRNIGHQVLLSNQDSTSRVLPVEQLSKQEYALRFENPIAINPESLVEIFIRHFNHQPEYTVEAKKVGEAAVQYSFVVSANKERTIIPCLERTLPEDLYEIVIHVPTGNNASYIYLAGAVLLLMAAAGWKMYKKKTPSPIPVPLFNDDVIMIGQFLFHPDQQKLELHSNIIKLTGKESQLLAILANEPNSIIDRSRLQKEVWEDEGVMVTRSLDMFISKLRKKLVSDPTVKIVNMHGKGYKLEIS